MAEAGAIAFLEANPALNVVRSASRFPAAVDGVHRAQLSGVRIDSREALFEALASELGFPEWFGKNWDALNDMLRDLSWLNSAGVVLLVSEADEMFRQAPRASAHLLEIWSGAAPAHAERGRALQLYLAFEE